MSFVSRIVRVGSLAIGGHLPVRVQSMTNTDTLDTESSIAQAIRIIEAGGELVRLTAQGVREAENLLNIRKGLREAGFETPLCADIHFNPAAAETAARIVEKVRINPGNYADKRASFISHELSESEYNAELGRTRERLLPLIKICRDYGTAIRVGVNHGSLSDRIMTRYGNTPEGMVMSAIEFLKIFMDEGFRDLIISMKSSDTRVMVESNRMLVRRMQDEGMDFPVHLGITEAGEGEDGRIISAAGIGTLLSEGIGDTIRVSLSEAPEREIPVAKEIIRFIGGPAGRREEPCTEVTVKGLHEKYSPVVLTDEKEIFKDEKGAIISAQKRAQISTFAADDICLKSIKSGVSGILNPVFNEDSIEKLQIDAAALLGRYFIDRISEGLCISNRGSVQGQALRDLSFSILQATEARITRTRYISCPTCGRTKFNLEEAVRKVKERTAKFSGLKIAVMGCIVNGPGEMAGADYGYIGAGPGKVHIYKGTTAVMKNISEEEAVEKLIEIIERDQARR